MSTSINIYNHKLELLSSKAIWWNNEHILLIADLHLGKTNHFRRSGIAVTNTANHNNLERLLEAIQNYRPKRVIFMGDLFHSHYNQEWEVFGQTLKSFPEISFELVMGNHDIMGKYQYTKYGLVIHKVPIAIKGLLLSHEPLEEIPANHYNLAGHIHPGVVLKGKGRQGIKLPCFWFGENQGLLPAFGVFTGLAKQKPGKKDRVFVIIENEVVQVN